MTQRLKQGAVLLSLLLGGILLGFGLLLAVYALPQPPIAEHVRLSAAALDGSWATGEIAYEQLVKGYAGSQLDNSTDAAMLLAAAHESDASLVQQVIDASTYTGAGTAYDALCAYGQSGPEGLASAPVARYWHGYLVGLKPLLLFLSYMDIRMLQMLLQGLLLAAVLTGFARRGLGRYGFAFALSLMAVSPAITGFSLQFSTTYTIFLLALLALLYGPGLGRTPFSQAVFFLLVGMATSYVDYLTYPLASFGMPFILLLVLRPPASAKAGLGMLLGCGLSWALGYGGMWAGKWLLTLLLGNDPWFFANLGAKLSERSAYQVREEALSFGAVLQAVLGIFAKKAYLVAGAMLLAGYAAALLRARLGKGKGPQALSAFASPPMDGALALLLTGLLPLAWFLFTANHSFNHAFFTSRTLVVTAFAFFCALAALWERVAAKHART